MTPATILALGLGSVAIGGAIGMIGVGGVLLVPLLLLVGGLPVHDAVAVAMAAYLVTGLVGTAVYGARREIPWPAAGWVGAAAMPGALAGSLVVRSIDGGWLTVFLAAFLGLAGLQSLRGRPSEAAPDGGGRLAGARAAVVGALTGFGSSATGTSGPVIGLPLLLHCRVPARSAVALCQAVQLPIALFASVANLAAGGLDVPLSAAVGLALGVGVGAGAVLAPRLPAVWLRRGIALGLLVSMALLLARAPILS